MIIELHLALVPQAVRFLVLEPAHLWPILVPAQDSPRQLRQGRPLGQESGLPPLPLLPPWAPASRASPWQLH